MNPSSCAFDPKFCVEVVISTQFWCFKTETRPFIKYPMHETILNTDDLQNRVNKARVVRKCRISVALSEEVLIAPCLEPTRELAILL